MNRIDWLVGSCSAWLSKSAAIQSGFVLGIGDDNDFRWPGDHVDADHAIKLPLGLRHPGIARAGDYIDRRDIRSVPYASAAIACAPPTRQISSTPARWAAAITVGLTSPPRGRRDHYQAFDTRNLGRNCVHQHR